jgi:hypothetical protein
MVWKEKMPAVVSKRGVMMGTKKVGTLSSRRKRVKDIITRKKIKSSNFSHLALIFFS